MTSPCSDDCFLTAPDGWAEGLLSAWHAVNAHQTPDAVKKAAWVTG